MFFNKAKAYIKGGKEFPNISGLVTFKEVSNGVLITAKIDNLPQSKDSCKRKIFWFSYTPREFLHWKYDR